MAKKGEKLSEEQKKKISEARLKRKKELGYINSPETRIKMSNAKLKDKCYLWKGGVSKDSNGYVIKYSKDNKNRFEREHRIIAQNILGRKLKQKEVIHHINGIRDDNRPENLYLFRNNSSHTKFHTYCKNRGLDFTTMLVSNLWMYKIK